MARREALQQKKTNMLAGQRQLETVRQDFERTNSVALAEEQPDAMHRWREVRRELQDYEDQIALVEAELATLDEEIDASMGMVRQAVQNEIDRLCLAPVQTLVTALQTLLEGNNQLRAIETCSGRLLGVGSLSLHNATIEPWLTRLQRKLALLVPQ
jgi:hypothetical protein